MEVQQDSDEARGARIQRTLAMLRDGTVIVEGAHDVRTLRLLGINAVPYPGLSAVLERKTRGKFYVMTDNDRGGEEKRSKIVSMLLETNSGSAIDEVTGRRMLNMLNVTCVEQVYGPVQEALEKGNGDYFGKDIPGYCKVHGSGKV